MLSFGSHDVNDSTSTLLARHYHRAVRCCAILLAIASKQCRDGRDPGLDRGTDRGGAPNFSPERTPLFSKTVDSCCDCHWWTDRRKCNWGDNAAHAGENSLA